MNESNFDWDNLRLFLAVARAGGLGPAAEQTGKSAPTLGRRMIELERNLGTELFHRKPRGYDLTEDGQALLKKVESIEARVRPVTESGLATAPPLVKISAGTWVTRSFYSSVSDMAELTVIFQCIVFNSVPVLAIGTNSLIREWIARRFGQFLVKWQQGSNV